MSLPFEITTHTPEQAAQWRRFAVSNPSRVVRVLGLTHGQRTREGDTLGDVYPALAAVVEISRPVRDGKNQLWEKLIDAGVAEVLCKNVVNMVGFVNFLPNVPEELSDQAKRQMPSPYAGALDALRSATYNFESPPTKNDKRVLDAMKKSWNAMMKRLWEDPANSLVPGDSHVFERIAIAQIVIRLIVVDPPFIATFYRPSDLTIQVIARHWKYATSDMDTRLTAGILQAFLSPSHPNHIEHARAHPPPFPQLLSKMYLGVAPTPTASVPKQAKAFVTVLASHFPLVAGSTAQIEVELLTEVLKLGSREEPELVKAVIKSTPLWNGAFRLMKKSAKGTEGLLNAEKEHEDSIRLGVMSGLLGTAADVLYLTSTNYPKECEPLVRIWANENLFGAIEECIEQLVSTTGVTMQLSQIASLIGNMIPNAEPSLIRLLGTQFPRWRILGVLFKKDMERQEAEGPPQLDLSNNTFPKPDSIIWDHGAWQTLASLQAECFDLGKTCAKRGCGNSSIEHCKMCKAVVYCSENCRAKDWKDHKLVCGWMTIIQNATSQGKSTTQVEPAPTPVPPNPQVDTGLEDLD